MEAIELKWIDTINREGLDSSQWGLCGSEVNSKEFYGVGNEELPPHLYVYGKVDVEYGGEMEWMFRRGYDKKMFLDETNFVAFFWIEIRV